MEVELLEIRDFLAAHPPFDAVPREALGWLPAELSIRYLRRGSAFPPPDGPGHAWLIRQGAVELRRPGGALQTTLTEGDLQGGLCGEDPLARELSGRAIEDTLVYVIPCAALDRLRGEQPEFERRLAGTLRERLRRTLPSLEAASARAGGLLDTAAGELASRPAISVGPETSVRQAAVIMSQRRVSSILVVEGEALLGILTDRDLRERCLAAGGSPEAPVSGIMTRRVEAIDAEVPAFEALLAMTRRGIHHLPVTGQGRVAGMLTTTDLVRHQGANAAYLVTAVRRAGSPAELAAAAARLPELQIQLTAAGVTAQRLGQAVSAVTDALTRRLAELAEAALGLPPVPYAWLASGSQARHEQTVHSDQDHVLLLADGADAERDDPWFAALARYVADGLAACGFTRCGGDVMATARRWRQPVSGWRRTFEHWIDQPERKALQHLCLFFDLRTVAGDEGLLGPLLDSVRARARQSPLFLGHLAANALGVSPPLGFFRQLVLVREGEHAHTVDLKLGGLIPVVDLARVCALATGSAAVSTVERLRQAAGSEALGRGGARDLEDAFAFVGALRARHQADQLERGLPPDNHLHPGELSALERSQLKDAFQAIRRQQELTGRHFQAEAFPT